jgi:hypothetical protein
MQAWAAGGIQRKSISTGAQYVTRDTMIFCEIFKMCGFSSENWFFCTKVMQLAMAGKGHNRDLYLQIRVICST